MSLDDLLPLLLVAFFVVNAFLRGGRSRRSGRGRSKTGAPPSAPARGTGRSGEAADAGPASPSKPGSTATPSSPASSSPPSSASETGRAGRSLQDDLSARLDEARRRVRQARGEGASQTSSQAGSSQAGSSQSPSPQSPPLSRASGSPQAAQASQSTRPASYAPGPAARGGTPASSSSGPAPPLGRERNAPPTGFLGREGPQQRRPQRPAAPVARTRRPSEASARLPAAVGIDLDPDDIVRGMVWSEILSPPVAARRWRRHASRRPSP